jgi:hypothetical protein
MTVPTSLGMHSRNGIEAAVVHPPDFNFQHAGEYRAQRRVIALQVADRAREAQQGDVVIGERLLLLGVAKALFQRRLGRRDVERSDPHDDVSLFLMEVREVFHHALAVTRRVSLLRSPLTKHEDISNLEAAIVLADLERLGSGQN